MTDFPKEIPTTGPKTPDSKSDTGLPEGRVGFRDYDGPSSVKAQITEWKKALDGNEWGFPGLRDPDFIESFVKAIPDLGEQLKYVINTNLFLSDRQYDQNFVLIYRRTIPSVEPKPEQHWSSDYITVRNGLSREILGTHRLQSIILCSTLADVLSDSGESKNPNAATSDGEIKVDTPLYDQKRAIFSFRPKEQQEELDAFLKIQGATS